MKSGKLSFYLSDSNELLPPAAVLYFTLTATIHDPFPSGYIIIDDKDGRILETLKIKPGNLIKISAVDTAEILDPSVNDFGPSYDFTPLVIVGLENTDPAETDYLIQSLDSGGKRIATLGGLIKIYLKHPWSIYTSWKNDAFTGQSATDIVKKVLADGVTQRGFSFLGQSIDLTDDSGTGPNRYKLQESEADFIMNKIVPYATSGDEPIYFFVDERNILHFQTFSSMFNNSPGLTLIAPVMDTMAEREAGTFPTVTNTDVLEVVDAFWYIGRNFEDQVKSMKKLIYTEDGDSKTSFKAVMLYKSKVPGYTLIKEGFITAAEATSIDLMPNRYFKDTVTAVYNQSKPMNEFFEVGIITSMCIDSASVGLPVDLQMMGNTAGVPHWINGKWLITRAEHFQHDGTLYSKLIIAKPTVNPENAVATGLDLTDFYQVGMS